MSLINERAAWDVDVYEGKARQSLWAKVSKAALSDSLSVSLDKFISKRIDPLYDYFNIVADEEDGGNTISLKFYGEDGNLLETVVSRYNENKNGWDIGLLKEYLLQENGDFLLLEDGSRLIL